MSTTGQHDDHGRLTGDAAQTGTDGSMARRVLAVATLWVPAIVLLLGWAAWSTSLPDTLPRHWNGSGEPDGFDSTAGLFVASMAIAGGAALLGTVAVFLPAVRPLYRRGILFFAGLAAGIGGSVWLLGAALTLGAGGDPTQAKLGVWFFVSMIACLWGVVPYLMQPRVRAAKPNNTPIEAIRLGTDELGAWSRSSTGSVFIWGSIIVAGIAIVSTIPLIQRGDVLAAAPIIAVMVAATLLMVAFIRIRITVDRRGLRIVSATLGFPLKRLPLSEIDAVQAENLIPMQWGGWGYRMMPGRSAVIMRGGDGIVVTRSNGTLFAVSTPDAATAAGLLEALREREGTDTDGR